MKRNASTDAGTEAADTAEIVSLVNAVKAEATSLNEAYDGLFLEVIRPTPLAVEAAKAVLRASAELLGDLASGLRAGAAFIRASKDRKGAWLPPKDLDKLRDQPLN